MSPRKVGPFESERNKMLASQNGVAAVEWTGCSKLKLTATEDYLRNRKRKTNIKIKNAANTSRPVYSRHRRRINRINRFIRSGSIFYRFIRTERSIDAADSPAELLLWELQQEAGLRMQEHGPGGFPGPEVGLFRVQIGKWDQVRERVCTQCDQIWRNLAKFGKTLAILKALFNIWKNFVPNFVNFQCDWANFLCC